MPKLRFVYSRFMAHATNCRNIIKYELAIESEYCIYSDEAKDVVDSIDGFKNRK